MSIDLLPLLPDVVFFQLGLQLPVQDLMQLQETYGKERKVLFQMLTVAINERFGFTGLTFVQIQDIVTQQPARWTLLRSMAYGDFPAYYHSLKGTFELGTALIKMALFRARDQVACAMLQDMELTRHTANLLSLAITKRCLQSTRYLVDGRDLLSAVQDIEPYGLPRFPLSETDLHWVLTHTKTIVTTELIQEYLRYKSNTNLLQLLQARLVTEERALLCEQSSVEV